MSYILPFFTAIGQVITLCPHFIFVQTKSILRNNINIFYFISPVGAAVKLAENKGIPLDKLSLEDLQTLDPKFEADVMNLWSYENR